MYDYFNGKLVEKNLNHVVIDVHGIGYKIYTPSRLFPQLPEVGLSTHLYVSWVVREMSQTLYGFAAKEERELFEQLLTISGIGPKTALNLVSHFELGHLEETIRKGNTTALSQVPGIGKKTAEKLIVDLKNKLKLSFLPTSGRSSKAEDALNALLRLGCTSTTASLAVKKAIEELSDDTDLSTLITAALKHTRP